MTPTTKERILDSAEQLFAERGFAETSLRALTQAAGVNLAAVHYHFGSKEALFQDVVRRLVGPVNVERLRLIDQLEARGPQQPPDIEELVEAFVGPALRVHAQADADSARLFRLMGRVVSTEDGGTPELKQVFREVEERFGPAFNRALPHLPPETFFWRLHFMIGVMCTSLLNPDRVRVLSNGLCSPDDADETLRQMVAFVSAGMQAPQPAPMELPSERQGRV